MKETLRILTLAMLTTIFISCGKNKPTFTNPQYFTPELKEQYIGILKEYQLNAEQLERVKQYHSQSEADIEFLNNSIVVVDSVVNKAVKLINEDRFNELMILLDDNKINFYTHPNNNALWLMDEFNSLLDILYVEYLTKEEGLPKAITIHELRKLSLEGVIAFDGANYRENKQAYDSVYIEELGYLINIYNTAGAHDDKIKDIEAKLMILRAD